MRDFLGWLGYILKKKREPVILILLAIGQIIVFLPFIREINLPKENFETLKQEAISGKKANPIEVKEFSFLEDFEERPIGYYFSRGQKDLFLRKIQKNNPDGKTEDTHKMNYVGLFRTEKEAYVMIKDESTGKNHFKREGEAIGNFKVIQIKKENVTLSDAGGKVISLSKTGKREE